jgi:hypothetical protein
MEEGTCFAGRFLNRWGGHPPGWNQGDSNRTGWNHQGDSNITGKLIGGSLFKLWEVIRRDGIIKVSRMEEEVRFAGRYLKLWGGYPPGWNHQGKSNGRGNSVHGRY